MNQSKEATPSTLEKSFFSDYTNSRIVTLHMQGKTKKQIIRAIGKSDHTQEVSQRHISWVVNRYEMYMRVYKHADITTARQGHKNEPYYKNEMEYGIKCVVPMSASERLILVKKEHIDSNYKKFIARS